MKYGCIGEKLSHSFSKEIHALLTDYEYDLKEIPKDALDAFLRERDFRAINVTIPYKQNVIPYLSYIAPEAKEIGAVNTIVNRDGALYGYNTDFFGICATLSHMGFPSLDGKKVLILGTGGTSLTARAVAKHLGAREVIRVSRTAKDGAVTYEEAHAFHTDAEILFNTTPAGMFPNTENTPISLAPFQRLEGVFDAIYNPLRSTLITEAHARGIPATGGLYMLVAQAHRAAEIFLDKPLPPASLDEVYKAMLARKENLVLIGMPASGKTTVGKALAAVLHKQFIDLDEELVRRAGKDIPTIFSEIGERGFRDMEEALIADVSARTELVIATGGGAVLREGNVSRLKKNGRILFLDRPLADLVPTADRPTASSREAIEKRYAERIHLYRAAADSIIDAKGNASDVLAVIRKELSH